MSLYTESRPPVPRPKRSIPSRSFRNTPKGYTTTSYIGPPGTYCHSQRPPPQEFEPDYAHEGEDGYGRPALAVRNPPTYDYAHSAHDDYRQIRATEPTAPRVVEDPTMIAYTGRPHDPWERCWELGCTKKGLHYHSLDEQPLEHKRKREVYSESESSDDDYRDRRRRRAAKQNKAGHSATYHRPRDPKSLIASGGSTTMELKEALPVPGMNQEPAAPQPQPRHPERKMTLPLRPSMGPPRERWAASPPPAANRRRVVTEHASAAQGLPLRSSTAPRQERWSTSQPPVKEKKRVDAEHANPPAGLSLRPVAAPPKEPRGKTKPPVANKRRSVPGNPPAENATPSSVLPLRPSPAVQQQQRGTTPPISAKKRRLVAANDLSSAVKEEDSELRTIAGRLLR